MANRLPLRDVKILDFMWVMAGPAATRMLADFGATVVRVESPSRVDTARTLHPRHHNEAAPDASGCFGNNNAGKLGIALDLSKPEGRAVVLDLVRWADVVTESFSPKAMRGWGLAYEDLRKVNPRIIMLSSCLMGQTGPLAKMAGFGTMGAAVSGFHNLTGWSDRAPAGVFGAYTDYVSPRFTAVAILAALEHRRRTGQGQYIDQSQAEASTHFLAPAILDWSANGRDLGRNGNFDPHHAPHGVYPAAGDDRWAAIVCRTDEEWRALCELIGRADLGGDPRLATAAGRIEHREEIDRAIAAWTRGLEPAEIERRAQAKGIPAHDVQSSRECFADPQLRHRGHFVELPHPVYGTTVVEGPRFGLSRTPGEVTRAAPSLGRDNERVLTEILGYDEERITALVVAGVMG
jgi:crotonobetainyl-CoA:carnitine CoA-transferase CaiB-like acyl-CoA transferase